MPTPSPTTRGPGWCRVTSSPWPAGRAGSAAGAPERVHAVLLDIDHTPRHVLHPSHAAFYTPEGLRALPGHLHPGGSSPCGPTTRRTRTSPASLRAEFGATEAHVVTFPNPLTGGTSANSVYVAVD